jgi:hypothetical protein
MNSRPSTESFEQDRENGEFDDENQDESQDENQDENQDEIQDEIQDENQEEMGEDNDEDDDGDSSEGNQDDEDGENNNDADADENDKNDKNDKNDRDTLKAAGSGETNLSNPLEGFFAEQPDAAGSKKRERSNAKAVECLDMDGNLIELFRSGMAASMKLSIPQGDISLCCRGLKPSVMGMKFRFFGDTEDRQAARLKKGFVLEGIAANDAGNKMEMTRTTRASRGEYGQGARPASESAASRILAPPELKVRTCAL